MKFWTLIFICWIAFPTFSQQNNTVEKKSTSEEDTLKGHSVKKAVLFSIVPGGGQIYNSIAMPKGKKRAYWKVPLIYAGLGAAGYLALQNNAEQKALKAEYINRTENFVYSDTYSNLDNQGILQLYQKKLSNRDLFFFGMGLVYLLQIADAAVEAHFVKFDVSENLSMRIRPAYIPISYGSPTTVGVSLQLSFK